MGFSIQMPAAFNALHRNGHTGSSADPAKLKQTSIACTVPEKVDSSESLSPESPANGPQRDCRDLAVTQHKAAVATTRAPSRSQIIFHPSVLRNTMPAGKTTVAVRTSGLLPSAAPAAAIKNNNTNSNDYHKPAKSSAAANEDPSAESPHSEMIIPISQPKLTSFTSSVSFSFGVDRYGFKKPLNYLSEAEFNAWSREYSEYMNLREKKWRVFLKSSGLPVEDENGGAPIRFPADSQKLRRYVRKGIPPKWRGNAWFWFARGHEKLNSHPGLYDELVASSVSLKNSDTEHIERDLNRTFPDNIYFHNDPITNEESAHLKSLRRVLRAFSVYQPRIGYCQSLNFIAANLLLMMSEEKAFWMLVTVTQNYLAGLHEVNLEQVNISQGILMVSVRDRLPKVWNALNLEQSFEDNFISNLPPISLCTAPWFMSLMVNVLPTETIMRVWDCFFLEGPKTLFRISLTIFKLMEPELLKASDELEVFQVIQTSPRKLHDPEVLMKACFRLSNGFGHISNDDIKLLRAFVQSRRKAAMEGLNLGTTDRNAYAKLHRGRRVRAKLIYH